jgi:hypothetical protein
MQGWHGNRLNKQHYGWFMPKLEGKHLNNHKRDGGWNGIGELAIIWSISTGVLVCSFFVLCK